jgi:cellulose synthase/poly-beta-1,6-N-acetylglucosamine synthase-like glycosyltransferase
VLLVTVLIGLLASLTLQALLRPAAPSRPVGTSVLKGTDSIGPLLDLSGRTVRSASGDQTAIGVALVDTGTSATAWDETLAVLQRHGAQATWLVGGRTLLDRSSAVRTVRAAGGELGVTGFSGHDLSDVPSWRLRLELSTTQAVLAARERITAPLLVLRGNATRDALDATAFRTARTAASEGYAVVVGSPPEQAGPGDIAVIPLDRRAPHRLNTLLERAETAGLRADAVSALAGLQPDDINRPVDGWARANAVAIVATLRMADLVDTAVGALFVPLTLLLAARAIVAVGLAHRHARRQRHADAEPPWVGPVTVIVPAYNEAAGIEATLRSLVASPWPHGLDVVVVDDGSTDGTGDIAEALRLPGVRVIRQPNLGKPAALNTGIAAATADVVVLVDGDTVFEPDTVSKLVAPFRDASVGAVSGNAKVLNRQSLLGRWQHVEYVMGFNLDRRVLAVCGAIPTVPGAAGAFDRRALADAGGLSGDTLAEDTDLTIAVQRAGWRVVYQDRAVAWTEAPSTVGDLWRQRYRWCYGTLQAAWKHRRALVEGRAIGMIGVPYALAFQVVLALLAPLVDVAALFGLFTADARLVGQAWLAFAIAQLALAVAAFRLDRESIRPLWAVPLQQFFYRQLMYLVVIQSIAAALAGTRLRWHKLRRLGDTASPGSPAPVSAAPARRRRRQDELAPWATRAFEDGS